MNRTDADRERVRAQRVARGLPPTVEDPAAYAKLAEIIRQQRAEDARAGRAA